MCQFVAAGDWVELCSLLKPGQIFTVYGLNRKRGTFSCRKLVKPLISTNNVKCPQSIFISLSKYHLMNFLCISTRNLGQQYSIKSWSDHVKNKNEQTWNCVQI